MVSRVEEIASSIVIGIRDGHYVSGQRLVEADLTKELKISRGPLREAFRLLDAKEVIELTPNRGATIKKITSDHAFQTLSILKILGSLTIKSFVLSDPLKEILYDFKNKKNVDIAMCLYHLKDLYLALSKENKNESLYSAISHLNISTFSRYIADCLDKKYFQKIDQEFQKITLALLEDNKYLSLQIHIDLFEEVLLLKQF
jgi:DNA-binding GntR family transcriptional regulator